MPDSQAGHKCNFELRTFLAANDEEGNSSDQRQPTEYWWNRNSIMIFPGGMDRADIKYFFLMGVIESLIGECQPAQDNQENPNPHNPFHIFHLQI